METVLDVLKAMEKASAREIAARMKIEPRDALEMRYSLRAIRDVPGFPRRRRSPALSVNSGVRYTRRNWFGKVSLLRKSMKKH
ncbi:hypothetical protein D6F12_15875 [Salmonella enterica]|nr:hypothetical protein [Salmonella enterica]